MENQRQHCFNACLPNDAARYYEGLRFDNSVSESFHHQFIAHLLLNVTELVRFLKI